MHPKKTFLGSIFGVVTIFVLWRGHFWTNLHEILSPGLKLILLATLFHQKNSFPTLYPSQAGSTQHLSYLSHFSHFSLKSHLVSTIILGGRKILLRGFFSVKGGEGTPNFR